MKEKTIIITIAVLILAVASFWAFADGLVITEDMIHEIMGGSPPAEESHDVMTKEAESLKEILGGFLEGDMEMIEAKAGEFAEAMKEVAEKYPLEMSEQFSAWKSMSEIVNQARQLQESAQHKDHKKAYDHFALLTYQCVQCHQVARSWGKLPEPEPESKTTAKSHDAGTAKKKPEQNTEVGKKPS